MKRDFVRSIYENPEAFGGKTVTVGGWVRNLRDSKAFGFIDLNDGSCHKNVQVVFEREKINNYDEIAHQNIGAALVIAALAADGVSSVLGLEFIDRGYEDLAGKLRRLGADIKRE